MIIKIIPIVMPSIDWDSFSLEARAALGYSVTGSLDAAALIPGSFKSFIAALGEFQQQGTNPITFVRSRKSDRALEHLTVSFLLIPNVLPDVMMLSKMSILISGAKAAIVTGNMRQWREVIIEGSYTHSTALSRQILNEVMKCFLRAGLGDLFADVNIVDLKDGTFALESRTK